MPKSTKDASYSQQHVQERALERYALTLLADDYRKLNEAVQRARSSEGEPNAAVTESAESELEPSPAPGAMALLNEEGDEQIWGVGWRGQTLVCVWSRNLRYRLPIERRATANLVGQIIDALRIGLVTQINASITPDMLVADILSIDFEVQNPLPFELALDRVASTAGINGTVYAAFSHAFSPRGIVLPPFGKATSGAVNDVRLTQGAMASLDIAGLGYLDLIDVDVALRAFTVGGKGGIPVPISGLHQAGVPTSYNVNLG
ncbi:hypothetical protein DFH08DRAFT_1090048 [Mycena albidolilacea]|uniref:Uncharacterized protein n=1 Tax=Mycena albidolilacea TaxID=1033008 RepID=A0AAD7E7K3_9AGAR|nr:hypothetical protein DFH08DRAFT_1090048 [Mycena albidolilacea]